MKKYSTLIISILLCSNYLFSQNLKADFTAKECIKELYRQGFDSKEQLNEWTLNFTNENKTWHLDNSNINGIPNFKAINPSSINSLAIEYDDRNSQNEILISPGMDIQPESLCTFYAAFDGVFVMYANFTIEVLNVETGKAETLFNAFLWSQESGHTRPKWLFFEEDLSKYAGQKVQFVFTYKGKGGDNVLIDDFCIIQRAIDNTSKAEIKEGGQVRFEDLSAGNPTSWEWIFEGGDPSASSDKNPVITYKKAGEYPVKLIVRNEEESDKVLKQDFVKVKGVSPIAAIEWPEVGYLSPYAGIFVPVGVDIQFTDKSLNVPTEWQWKLPGSTNPVANEQNPVVKYNEEGIYNVSLRVTNATGTDITEYERVLQAGGEQSIWNIEMEESGTIGEIYFPFYGYYGGTNRLDMLAFAEYFRKPVVSATISKIGVFFSSVSIVTPEAPITVSIAKSNNGLPGERIVSSTVLARDLVYDENVWKETFFEFDSPVDINEDFFVVIEGFPHDPEEEVTNDIAMGTVRRQEGGKCTTYHFLEMRDDNEKLTGEKKWFKNEDEAVSFGITPFVKFDTPTSIKNVSEIFEPTILCAPVNRETIEIFTPEKVQEISVYTLSGQQLYYSNNNVSSIPVSSWVEGFYIIKGIKEGEVVTQKIQITR